MTAQFAETLHYEGERRAMCSEPLGDYFFMAGIKPGFIPPNTALWRGYMGTWEIVTDRLYLIGLTGDLPDGKEASIETFFPGFPDRVFAHWYSGIIRIPQGARLKYVHMGYGSTHERDLLLELKRGVVVRKHVRHNGEVTGTAGADQYGPGAVTHIHPQKTDNKGAQ